MVAPRRRTVSVIPINSEDDMVPIDTALSQCKLLRYEEEPQSSVYRHIISVLVRDTNLFNKYSRLTEMIFQCYPNISSVDDITRNIDGIVNALCESIMIQTNFYAVSYSSSDEVIASSGFFSAGFFGAANSNYPSGVFADNSNMGYMVGLGSVATAAIKDTRKRYSELIESNKFRVIAKSLPPNYDHGTMKQLMSTRVRASKLNLVRAAFIFSKSVPISNNDIELWINTNVVTQQSYHNLVKPILTRMKDAGIEVIYCDVEKKEAPPVTKSIGELMEML